MTLPPGMGLEDLPTIETQVHKRGERSDLTIHENNKHSSTIRYDLIYISTIHECSQKRRDVSCIDRRL